MTMREDTIIAVVGLGYVGLPLAIELEKNIRLLAMTYLSPRY